MEQRFTRIPVWERLLQVFNGRSKRGHFLGELLGILPTDQHLGGHVRRRVHVELHLANLEVVVHGPTRFVAALDSQGDVAGDVLFPIQVLRSSVRQRRVGVVGGQRNALILRKVRLGESNEIDESRVVRATSVPSDQPGATHRKRATQVKNNMAGDRLSRLRGDRRRTVATARVVEQTTEGAQVAVDCPIGHIARIGSGTILRTQRKGLPGR